VSWSLYDVVEMKDELKAIFGRDVDIVEKGLSATLSAAVQS